MIAEEWLKTYEDAPFFHFVFHDGVLEALDNRKKIVLLDIVREQTKNKKTQYIMTLIDSDIPRDAEGNRKCVVIMSPLFAGFRVADAAAAHPAEHA